jgi:large subunit ribosomal protein L31
MIQRLFRGTRLPRGYTTASDMKKDLHPDYHPVLFLDAGAGFEFASRSTLRSDEKREIDGVEHDVIRLEISSASHPFFTGRQHFVDTAGRIEKFQRKYGDKKK